MTHTSPITCLDHDPATGLTVTGGYDGRVLARDADRSVRWETSFDDLVNDVRISPSGRVVAVAAADSCAYLLDAGSGARFRRFGPHGDDVNAVRWSPDGTRVACVMDHHDTAVHIWQVDAADHQPIRLAGHASGVFAAAFDPSGTLLATVAEDSTARIWHIESRSVLHVLEHPADPEALDWSPDGRFVVTGADDGMARVWNPDTGQLVREIGDAVGAVRFVRFDPGGARALLGAYDGVMRVYDTQTWQVLESLTAPFQWERTGGFTSEGVMVGSFGSEPVEHSATIPLNALPLTTGINAIAVAGGALLVGRDDGTVLDVWQNIAVARHDTIVNTVALAPGERVLASGDYRGEIRLTSLDPGQPATVARSCEGGPVNSIVWHPDGCRFFSGGYDGRIRAWSVADDRSGEFVCTADHAAAGGPIKQLAWSGSTQLLIAASSDGSVSAWRDAQEVWRAAPSDMVLVNSVACADAAGTVVTASRDRAVRVWRAADGELVDVLGPSHLKSVKTVATSPAGTCVVTGSYDGTAHLWHFGDFGWSWQPLRRHGKPGVSAVALTADAVYTAGWDGTLARWSRAGAHVADLVR